MAEKKLGIIEYFSNFFKRVEENKDNLSYNQKAVLPRIKESFEELKENTDSLTQIFSSVPANPNSSNLTPNGLEKYPKIISKLHNRLATISGGVFFAGASLGLLFLLGGGNPAAWAPSFIGIFSTVGVLVGTSAAAVIKGISKKTFNINKPRLFERKRVKELKRLASAQINLDAEINLSMNEIISGDYNFQERVTQHKTRRSITGKTYNVEKEVTKLKEQFSHLPKKVQKKLKKVISSRDDNIENLITSYSAFVAQGIVESQIKLNNQLDHSNEWKDILEDTIRDARDILNSKKAIQKDINAIKKELSMAAQNVGNSIKGFKDTRATIKQLSADGQEILDKFGSQYTSSITKALQRSANIDSELRAIIDEAQKLIDIVKNELIPGCDEKLAAIKAAKAEKKNLKTQQTTQQSIESTNKTNEEKHKLSLEEELAALKEEIKNMKKR